MNRLHSELHRLYPPPAPDGVRGLLLELARPADWTALGAVWRGVQAELQLPAPGIAVSGTDGLQLWFSLQQPVTPARATDFLARLQARYLPGIAASRLRLLAGAALPALPAQDTATGNWSAFVAPDLAPVFADTPWLDIQPGADGQADLLARLACIKPSAFDAAMQALQPAPTPVAAAPGETADLDPRGFLQRVLNDESAPLALRIEAAKALLSPP
ncbi:hypothetical protein ACG02S_11855 [Roseateles sp. DC23W]|uniref:Uncharacterized protein n=1 Tax=Pelomonas dachongensis TaxID=3299029 RepID=A0ABW7EQQ1_9BURK